MSLVLVPACTAFALYMPATDRLKLVVADIAKAVERYNENGIESVWDEADAWMLALGVGFEEDDLMDALKDKFPSLKQFADMYGLAAGDPAVVERYDFELRSWRETQSRNDYFKRKGLEEGWEKGRRETLIGLYIKGVISAEIAAAELDMGTEDFLALCEETSDKAPR